MDKRVECLTTPEECDQFIMNVRKDYPDLADQARRKRVQLKAARYKVDTLAEEEAIKAVCAYEEVLSAKRGRKVRASRTWQMIERHGIIGAVERAVNRKDETQGYSILVEMNLQDFAFENVVLKYPELFSDSAIIRSKERIQQL